MRKLILGLILIALMVGGGYIALTKPCFAKICMGSCLNSSACAKGCVCVRQGAEMGSCESYN